MMPSAMPRPLSKVLIAAGLFLGLTACHDDPVATGGGVPEVMDVAAVPNPQNTLSWIATFRSRRADSARVVCLGGGDAQALTPFSAVSSPVDSVLVLDRGEGACAAGVEVMGSGGATEVPVAALPAFDLPVALQGVHLQGTGTAQPGYTLLEVTRDTVAFIVAFGPAGDVRWYRAFPLRPGELVFNAAQQPNGDFTLYIGPSTGSAPAFGRFEEVEPGGRLVRTWIAPPPFYTDPHELIVETGDAAVPTGHLIGYALRPTDLTAYGGTSSQLLAGHTLIRETPGIGVDFLWNAWDHYSPSDWLFAQPQLATLPVADLDHANSLALTGDGNYLASFAMLGQVAKIDAVTGRVIWRLGGKTGQFAIVGDPLGGFGPEHDVRELPNGDILMFDNGLRHVPPESRAVEYRLDTVAMTATMVWQYRHSPALLAPAMGSARRLADGHTLVGFSSLSRVVEVAPDGTVAWEGVLTINGARAPFFYRATHVESLYRASAAGAP